METFNITFINGRDMVLYIGPESASHAKKNSQALFIESELVSSPSEIFKNGWCSARRHSFGKVQEMTFPQTSVLYIQKIL